MQADSDYVAGYAAGLKRALLEIESEPELPGTPWASLGLWRGTVRVLRAMLHPIKTQRNMVRLTKQRIMERVMRGLTGCPGLKR